MVLIIIIAIIFYIVSVIGCWKVFKKAGRIGILSIIPIVNVFVICKIAWGRYAWAWLFLIPFVNIIIAIITYYKLSKSFGHGVGYTVGLIFLPLIFFILIGFGPEPYLGPGGENADQRNGTNGGDNLYEFTSYSDTSNFCPKCGAKIASGAKFCSRCGAKLS